MRIDEHYELRYYDIVALQTHYKYFKSLADLNAAVVKLTEDPDIRIINAHYSAYAPIGISSLVNMEKEKAKIDRILQIRKDMKNGK